jgi:hypothetical protein
MSRAGKFIPGGGGKARRTGPIRAPDPSAPPGSAPTPSSPDGKKKPFGKGLGLTKPVDKKQRLPITIMSAVLCCLLVSVAWYTMAYQPAMREIAAYKLQVAADAAAAAAAQAEAEKEHQAELLKLASERGVLTVDTNPTGASVTIGDFRKTTPAKFTDLIPGTFSILIHADGYEDYKQEVTISADQPTDLGTIQLAQQTGSLSLTSPQSNVTYKITGPGDYSHEGQVPDKLDKLAVGDYVITASQQDWTLSPISVTLHDGDSLQKDIKFPYGKVSITTTPPGATVRNGRIVLGQTPLNLPQLHPGDLSLSIDLPPYTLQRIDLHVPDFGNVSKQITLQQDKDFIAACGMPMVWISDGGGFWAGKYDVRQSDFETVTGDNPSTFRGPSLPVETVSWENAMAFVDKLNQYEAKAGKLPKGYHYSLPKESQWETFSADANIDLAATSRINTLASTQEVGYSEPNKYGLYDTIGNVWEWCLDDFDQNGNHSLRGGCWLSSAEHFPTAATRNAGGAKYADQFTGFRVVLVPN